MVDFDAVVAVLFPCLRFGEPDGADFWVGEDDGGNVAVIEAGGGEVRTAFGMVGPEDAIAEGATGGDGDWRF